MCCVYFDSFAILNIVLCDCFPEKEDTKVMTVTLLNLNRFSNFFHQQLRLASKFALKWFLQIATTCRHTTLWNIWVKQAAMQHSATQNSCWKSTHLMMWALLNSLMKIYSQCPYRAIQPYIYLQNHSHCLHILLPSIKTYNALSGAVVLQTMFWHSLNITCLMLARLQTWRAVIFTRVCLSVCLSVCLWPALLPFNVYRFWRNLVTRTLVWPGYCNWTGSAASCCDRSSGAFRTVGIRNWGRNRAVKTHRLVGPIANLKGHYFQWSLSVSLSVCLCVYDRHFCPSTLTDFDETWSQWPYSDLVWPRP